MKKKPKNINEKTKEEIMVENLKDIKEIFDKHSINFWLDWGTLLGAIRDGKIIKWDGDTDLGMIEDDFKRVCSILPEIKKRGFFIDFPPIPIPRIAFSRSGYKIDICFYFLFDQINFVALYSKITEKPIARLLFFILQLYKCAKINIYPTLPQNKPKFIIALIIKSLFSILPNKLQKVLAGTSERILIKKNYIFPMRVVVPKHHLEKFRTIDFYDINFKIPLNAEEYLKYKYGLDWKIPKRRWNWQNEDGAVTSLANNRNQSR